MNKTLTEEDKLQEIFLPRYNQDVQDFKSKQKKFAHYTSAEKALKILSNKEIWFRQTSTMNDYSEVHHGIDSLIAAYDGHDLKDAINQIYPDLTKKIETLFDKEQPGLKCGTFVFCVSEMEIDTAEDKFGRLSMWRAYGANSGVALILNPAAFFQENDGLDCYTLKIDYGDKEEYKKYLDEIREKIIQNQDFLKSLGEERLAASINRTLQFYALKLKHSGFKEEGEWRVIYSDALCTNARTELPHMKFDNETIHGIPQQICKFPLKNNATLKTEHLDPHELIEGIIIGPSDSEYVIYEAFLIECARLGIKNPENKIKKSRIPLRS